MENLPLLFLQISAGIILFYLIYLLLLKDETYYRANRFFLLGGLFIALLIPLFPISYESPISLKDNSSFFTLSENTATQETSNSLNTAAQSESMLSISNLLLWIYIIGMSVFLIRLIIQTISISRKIRHSDYKIIDGIRIIDLVTSVPYSFFNTIIIDIQKYSERELSNIIAHEKVHIRERHWVDLLIIELLSVLFWVNPVVWLYERAIKQNHEYLADQGVLLAGYSPSQYQALLINQLMGVKVLGFAHNLNFSLNKKRMEMMKKEKSPRVSKMKLLLALPIIALLVFAFARKEYVVENTNNSSQIIEKNQVQVSGLVQNNKKMPLEGINILIKGTSTGTITDENGHFTIEAPDNAELVFAFVNFKTQIHKIALMDVNNVIITLLEDTDKSKPAIVKVSKELVRISGLVQNENDSPLAGVNIIVKATTSGTITDDNGRFTIDAPADASLIFSFIGYETQAHKIAELDIANTYIQMREGVFNIEFTQASDSKVKNSPADTSEPNEEVEVYSIVEEMPNYKNGGMEGLANDLNIMINVVKKQTTDRGIAIVGFTVSSEGKVTNPLIIKSTGSALLDDLAVKFVQKLDNWNPGIQRGKPVKVNLTVPVKFE